MTVSDVPGEMIYICGRPCLIRRQVNAEYLLILLAGESGMGIADEIFGYTRELTDADFACAAVELTNEECVPLHCETQEKTHLDGRITVSGTYRPEEGYAPESEENGIAEFSGSCLPYAEHGRFDPYDTKFDMDKCKGALKLLGLLEENILPKLKEKLYLPDDVKIILGGHGMAGMFAIWAGLMSDSFYSIAAVSPAPLPKWWDKFSWKYQPLAQEMYVSYGDREVSAVYNAAMYRRCAFPVLAGIHIHYRNDRLCLQSQRQGGHNDNVVSAQAEGFAWGMGFEGGMFTDGDILVSYTPRKGLKRAVIPEGVTKIAADAFRNCDEIEEVVIPEGVTTIGRSAFYKCSRLARIQIPESVEVIEGTAFSYTQWLNDRQEDFVIINGILVKYKGSGREVHVPEGVRKLAVPSFRGKKYVEVIYLPESLEEFDDEVFSKCPSLREIRIPVPNPQLKPGKICVDENKFERFIAGEKEYIVRNARLLTEEELREMQEQKHLAQEFKIQRQEESARLEEELKIRRQEESALREAERKRQVQERRELTDIQENVDIEEVLELVSRELPPEPCIDFGIKRRRVTQFSSKLGGLPYFPKDMQFPTDSHGKPMWFMAQLNFEELPRIKDFPQKGILQFFISAVDGCYGMGEGDLVTQKDFRVIYHEDILGEQQLITPADLPQYSDEYGDFPFEGEYKLVAHAPDVKQPDFMDYRFNDIMIRCYNSLSQQKIKSEFDINKNDRHLILHGRNSEPQAFVGGYPYFTQNDPRDHYEDIRDCDKVLFELSSLYDKENGIDIMFGDGGTATFLIPKENLKRLDFSRVAYNFDCL